MERLAGPASREHRSKYAVAHEADSLTAVVLTHRRPRLATMAVRSLLDDEGLSPENVIVVVNGEGGLEDEALERSVRMVRLSTNEGPSGGFRAGLLHAFAEPGTRWAYVCEDDVSLLHLPVPRLADLVQRVEAYAEEHGPVGAVAPFGRVFVKSSGHTYNFVPRLGLPEELAPVDVTTWGATLVSRDVVEAGVLPDSALFFGFEDFDFFCSMRAAGFPLLVDVLSSRRVVQHQTLDGRDAALRDWRPLDADEPWRAYYFARNFFALARRHGRRSWIAWHLLYSLRRLQLAHSSSERLAIIEGLVDGARGRLGKNGRYLRRIGERARDIADGTPRAGKSAAMHGDARTSDLAGGVLAMIVTHNAPSALARCIDAIRRQTTPPAAILVIDNASEPAVVEEQLVGSVPIDSVRRSGVNLGPAGGWAIAFDWFRNSNYEHAWALDDDMLPDPDCLETLLDRCAGDPKTAFCFPYSVESDGTVGAWGSWCGFVVSRHIVEQVGLPRAEMFWWAEDNEYLLWRIPRAGFTRSIVAGALVQHDAVRQGTNVPLWKYYYEARNMLYLHLHVMRRVGWYPRNVAKLVARAVLREKGRRARSLWVVARGLLDGARGRLGIRYPVEPMHEQVRRSALGEIGPTGDIT